ncbi:MAG: hypothetical protein IKM97_03950 [Clostridia bacterium]|nr:hypothetical protein [Clostridia bacterium]
MLKIKNENGISLIVLVVTIIVLFIIFSVTINIGTESIYSSKDKKLMAEIEIVQQACISEYEIANKLGYLENPSTVPANFVGTEVLVANLPSITGKWVIETEPLEAYKKYFRLNPYELEQLGIKNSEDTYIVNYYTGEVYNETVRETSDNVLLYIKSLSSNQVQKQIDNTSFVDETW